MLPEEVSMLTSMLQLFLMLVQNSIQLCLSLMWQESELISRATEWQAERLLERSLTQRRRRRRRSPYDHQVMESWLTLALEKPQRRCWVYPTSKDWWEKFVLEVWSEEEWLKNFRMTRETFNEILQTIAPRLDRKVTRLRRPVPPDKRLAAALWYLSGKSAYRLVRQQFGLGLSTVSEIVNEVCMALEADLFHKTVCLGNSVGTIMDGFGRLGFPNCIGAVDGTHIHIRMPAGGEEIFRNRKGFASVILQGTVDHTGRFIDAETGYPGVNHDAFVFRFSNLFRLMDAGKFVPGNPHVTLNGVQIPPLLVADSAYPIRPWLMCPYAQGGDRRKRNFNKSLSKARNVVERAFGRLKSRWGCLQFRLDISLQNVTSVVIACVILHNICEAKGHAILDEEYREECVPELPPRVLTTAQEKRVKKAGEQIREAIADFLMERGGAGHL